MILKYFKYFLLGIGIIQTTYAQSIYKKDSLTILADSLHVAGNYKESLIIRKQALNNVKSTSKDYYKYVKAKYYHTQSSDYEVKSYNYYNPNQAILKAEREKYLDSALTSAIKARDIYKNVKNPDKHFQYDLQNRIYHQTAYLSNWKHALEEAQFGLSILKDTLTEKDKKVVDLIYDIGYIYSQLGDFSKAIDNYQSSLNLYKKIIGETNKDVALAYNNISVEYRNLGLRKKEQESLLKAKTIWETLNNEEDKQFLYRCYGNLFYWYSYYGDYSKAEEFMVKRNKLREEEVINKIGFMRNDEEVYEEKLTEWYDLILHSLRKKDTTKAIVYTKKILNTVNSHKDLMRFETNIYSSTLKYYSDILCNNEPEKALKMLSKAIDIQKKYKNIHHTNPIPYQIKKAELLLNQKKYAETKTLLNYLLLEEEPQKIPNLFHLYILNGKTLGVLGNKNNAQVFFDKAFLHSIISVDIPLAKATFKDLKPIISFETVDGFIAMGDFYFDLFKESKDRVNLTKAFHRYTLASKIYNNLYLGQRYNNRLFDTYTSISQRLLQCVYEEQENKQLLLETINEMENNGSKLTWSKFMFNNQRKQINLPEQLLNEEENLKAQLNFYRNKLFNQDETSVDKKSLWKEKIYELEASFSKIQDTVKKYHNSYYQFNFQSFDIKLLQQELDTDSTIIKYIITKDNVFSILILKNNVKLYHLGDKKTINILLKKVLHKLRNRAPDYQDDLNKLKNLLLKQIPLNAYNNITIVPDGFLFYLPFEMLIFSENMPVISYSPSLLLFKEQKTVLLKNKDIQVGAFASSANKVLNSPQLTNANIEIKNILDIFDGKAFIDSSKEIFLKEANQFDILHLAMHSSIDNTNPEYSSLNFYENEQNNRLFISELYNETFNANMVVLSACNTGSGLYEDGEGVISLSRAFTYAGVSSMMMSLWKVPDKETSQIMISFYKHLKDGKSKNKALQLAKLDYLNATDDDLLKHPYYWAGFVISGDTSAITSSTNYLLWGLLSMVIILFIGLILKKSINFFK